MHKLIYSFFVLLLLASFHQTSLSAVYKCELSGGKIEYQATPCMSGRDISNKPKQPVTTNSANTVGMKKADWLLQLKPLEIQGQCANSPLKRKFTGSYQECSVVVEKLFDKCANNVENVKIPDMLTSLQEAKKYGSVMGECITAHYFGGEHLSIFNKMQATSINQPTKLYGKWKSKSSKAIVIWEFTASTMSFTTYDFSGKPLAAPNTGNVSYTLEGKTLWRISDSIGRPNEVILAAIQDDNDVILNLPKVGDIALKREPITK